MLLIALRLAMLAVHPIPIPFSIDDMSFALLGDTLTHFRFSNPPHPMHRFFETLFVLQEPRYASIYPAGQGMAIAIGLLLFGNAWAGIAISTGGDVCGRVLDAARVGAAVMGAGGWSVRGAAIRCAQPMDE